MIKKKALSMDIQSYACAYVGLEDQENKGIVMFDSGI